MTRLAVILTVLATMAGVSRANILVNPGFETEIGATDWSIHWGTFSRENWNKPPEGKFAGFIKGDWAGDDRGGVIQALAASPETQYTLTAKFYCDNGWQAQTQVLKLEFFDGDGNLLKTFSTDLAKLAEQKWTEKKVFGVSPAGTAKAQVVFEATGVGKAGLLGVDGFDLETTK